MQSSNKSTIYWILPVVDILLELMWHVSFLICLTKTHQNYEEMAWMATYECVFKPSRLLTRHFGQRPLKVLARNMLKQPEKTEQISGSVSQICPSAHSNRNMALDHSLNLICACSSVSSLISLRVKDTERGEAQKQRAMREQDRVKKKIWASVF